MSSRSTKAVALLLTLTSSLLAGCTGARPPAPPPQEVAVTPPPKPAEPIAREAAPQPVTVAPASPRLRFDGLYFVPEPGGEYAYYFRFYPDGDVVCASSSGTPEDVREWLVLEQRGKNEAMQYGTYVLTGEALEFSCISKLGVVEHRGTAQGDKLALKSHSLINDHRSERRYGFAPFR